MRISDWSSDVCSSDLERKMTKTILDMRDIQKCFGPVKALSRVNLKVGDGEIHAICGENGAGKSTLMKILSGVYPHGSFTGEIDIGRELSRERVCPYG